MGSEEILDFPYEFRKLEPEQLEGLPEESLNYVKDFVQVGPQNICVPKYFEYDADWYYNMPLRQNDVIVTGFPRSGTTMTQELVWLVLNDFNFKLAGEKTFIERVPVLEGRALFGDRTIPWDSLSRGRKILFRTPEIMDQMTTRRVMKTHIPFSLLPQDLLTRGCKVIYLARNPKDVVVSLYYLQRRENRFTGSFQFFFTLFLSGLNLFGPYWTHVQQGWERRFSENVFFVFYEDLIKDKRNTLKKMFEFLGEDLTEFQLDLIDFVSDFDNFKKYISQRSDNHLNNREDANLNFIRKGEIGNNKEYFTKEMDEEFEKWCQENLESTGIKFPVELI